MSVRKTKKNGKDVLLIDFTYTDRSGSKCRLRKVADVQTMMATKAELQRLLAHCAAHGVPYDTRAPCMMFDDFARGEWATWSRTHHKPSTRKRYDELLEREMLAEFAGTRLDEIDARRVTAYASSLLDRGIEAWHHISLLSSMLKVAVELGVLDEMPSFKSPRRNKEKLVDCPDVEEFDAMLSAATGWIHTAIALAGYAGLRSGEVRALEVRDIDWKRGMLLVRRSLSEDEVTTTKSDKERRVPIAPCLAPILLRMARERTIVWL